MPVRVFNAEMAICIKDFHLKSFMWIVRRAKIVEAVYGDIAVEFGQDAKSINESRIVNFTSYKTLSFRVKPGMIVFL